MHFPAHLLPLLAAGLMACDTSSTTATNSAPAASEDRPAGKKDGSADAAEPAQTTPASKQYRLLGVVDPELGMVAYALKVPRTWQVKQSYQRQWSNNIPSDKVYLSFRAPDGSQQIEYLPMTEYGYSEGPSRQQMEMQAQAMGMQLPPNPGELAPMPVMAYLKQILLPQLAQKGLQLRNLSNERQTPPQRTDAQTTKSRASIDGVLPNGRNVRVECRMSVNVLRSNGDTFYGWGVVPSITQTSGDLAAAYETTRVAQESIVVNPAWQRQRSELVNQGINANTAAMTRQHQANMANIAQQGAANTTRHEARMAAADQRMADWQQKNASQDRQHEYYVDNAIRGETKYRNPSTGEQVKADNTYNHVYTDNKGTYYGSNTPLDAGSINWQELAKVSLKDY